MSWRYLGSSSSFPIMRLLCAMTISSTAMGFLSSRDNQRFPSSPLSSFNCPMGRFLSLGLQSDSYITKCDNATKNYIHMPLPDWGQETNGHAIFDSLLGEGLIESYNVFRRPDESYENAIQAFIKFGDRVDGHPGIVHGGILSLLFDDALGFAYVALGVSMAFTANLTIDYRAPVPAGTSVKISVKLEQREGRKLFFKAKMTSLDETLLYAEASSLYIIPREASKR